MKETIIVGEFKMTGKNEIDVEKVVKKWNHLWLISQYGAEFRLVKGIRKDSSISEIKLTISAEQADELIDKIGLAPIKSGIFTKALTWKKS